MLVSSFPQRPPPPSYSCRSVRNFKLGRPGSISFSLSLAARRFRPAAYPKIIHGIHMIYSSLLFSTAACFGRLSLKHVLTRFPATASILTTTAVHAALFSSVSSLVELPHARVLTAWTQPSGWGRALFVGWCLCVRQCTCSLDSLLNERVLYARFLGHFVYPGSMTRLMAGLSTICSALSWCRGRMYIRQSSTL